MVKRVSTIVNDMHRLAASRASASPPHARFVVNSGTGRRPRLCASSIPGEFYHISLPAFTSREAIYPDPAPRRCDTACFEREFKQISPRSSGQDTSFGGRN